MPNQLGKRLVCETCGGQIVITKPGEGAVTCCDKPMQQMDAKKLPSSD